MKLREAGERTLSWPKNYFRRRLAADVRGLWSLELFDSATCSALQINNTFASTLVLLHYSFQLLLQSAAGFHLPNNFHSGPKPHTSEWLLPI